MDKTDPVAIKAANRPLIFQTPEDLQEAVDKYFKSCFAPKMVVQQDKDGNPIENSKGELTSIPVIDNNGDQVLYQTKPLTMTGLARMLDINRRTLVRYSHRKDYSIILDRAKQVIEEQLEERLWGANTSGVALILKNNYGYADKREIENTGQQANLTMYLPKPEDKKLTEPNADMEALPEARESSIEP